MGVVDPDAAHNPDVAEAVVQLALLDAGLHRALLDRLDEGVCMVNRDHRILYWNSGAERMSGYLAHEVAGQFSHGDLLMHCESDGSLVPGEGPGSPVVAAMLDGKPHESTVFLLHKEGHRLLVQLQARPIRDPNGGIAGAVELFEEVSAPLHDRAREMEIFGFSDSSTRAANRKFGEMMLRHTLEAFDLFEIPFWMAAHRIGQSGGSRSELRARNGGGGGEIDRRHVGSEPGIARCAGALGAGRIPRGSGSLFALRIGRRRQRLRLLVRASALDWWGDRLGVTVSVGGATAEPGDSIESLEQRVGEVYEGCQAAGGDRTAIAHLVQSGAQRCSP